MLVELLVPQIGLPYPSITIDTSQTRSSESHWIRKLTEFSFS